MGSMHWDDDPLTFALHDIDVMTSLYTYKPPPFTSYGLGKVLAGDLFHTANSTT